MLAERRGELHLDPRVGEMGIALAGRGPTVAATEPELLAVLAPREDPREAIERALGDGGVGLEALHQAGGEGALRAAVRTVEEDEAVRPPLAREADQRAVEGLLDRLLADQVIAPTRPRAPLGPFERKVEDAVPAHLSRRPLERIRAEVIDAVEEVARRVAGVPRRRLPNEREVFLEREHALLGVEARLHSLADPHEIVFEVVAHAMSFTAPAARAPAFDLRRCSSPPGRDRRTRPPRPDALPP